MKIASAEYIRSAHKPLDFLDDGKPEVAFSGRSNVGKSSLLNCLLGRRGLARISSTPGRTQAINYFLINRSLYFVDLPGYGYAKASKTKRQQWAVLMEDYLQHSLPRATVVLLVDAKVGATNLDVQAFEYFEHLGGEPLVVATKIDKVKRGRRPATLRAIRERLSLSDEELVTCSSQTKEGIKDLWQAIQKRS